MDKDKFLQKEVNDSLDQAMSGFTLLSTNVDNITMELTTRNVGIGHKCISELIATPSKWTVDLLNTVSPTLTTISEKWTEPKMLMLAAMETKTSLLALNYGISKMTSVSSQINSISDMLSSQPDYIRELIAPAPMLNDLQSIATQIHQSIQDDGKISAWQLGLVDSASFLVDRQVDWAAKLFTSVYEEKNPAELVGLRTFSPKVNAIKILSADLEKERKQKKEIAPKEALENSTVLKMTEKGKNLIDKVACINKMCKRTGHDPLFKFTEATMTAAATIGGTVCLTKDVFGNVLDGLYFIFYENLERIKNIVSDEAVRDENIYQCIFRVKHIRTDFRHDYTHGSESKVRKKENDIGESYTHYVGKPVLLTEQDFLMTQEKMYDEFGRLMDYLMTKVADTVS